MANNKLTKSLKQTLSYGAGAIFAFMILQGAIALFPEIAGTTLIIIGIIGLTALTYLGLR